MQTVVRQRRTFAERAKDGTANARTFPTARQLQTKADLNDT